MRIAVLTDSVNWEKRNKEFPGTQSHYVCHVAKLWYGNQESQSWASMRSYNIFYSRAWSYHGLHDHRAHRQNRPWKNIPAKIRQILRCLYMSMLVNGLVRQSLLGFNGGEKLCDTTIPPCCGEIQQWLPSITITTISSRTAARCTVICRPLFLGAKLVTWEKNYSPGEWTGEWVDGWVIEVFGFLILQVLIRSEPAVSRKNPVMI